MSSEPVKKVGYSTAFAVLIDGFHRIVLLSMRIKTIKKRIPFAKFVELVPIGN